MAKERSLFKKKKPSIFCLKKFLQRLRPHQWWNDSALKIGRWEVSNSIPYRAYRLSRSEFSMAFSETAVNTGWKTPHGRYSTYNPWSLE